MYECTSIVAKVVYLCIIQKLLFEFFISSMFVYTGNRSLDYGHKISHFYNE